MNKLLLLIHGRRFFYANFIKLAKKEGFIRNKTVNKTTKGRASEFFSFLECFEAKRTPAHLLVFLFFLCCFI